MDSASLPGDGRLCPGLSQEASIENASSGCHGICSLMTQVLPTQHVTNHPTDHVADDDEFVPPLKRMKCFSEKLGNIPMYLQLSDVSSGTEFEDTGMEAKKDAMKEILTLLLDNIEQNTASNKGGLKQIVTNSSQSDATEIDNLEKNVEQNAAEKESSNKETVANSSQDYGATEIECSEKNHNDTDQVESITTENENNFTTEYVKSPTDILSPKSRLNYYYQKALEISSKYITTTLDSTENHHSSSNGLAATSESDMLEKPPLQNISMTISSQNDKIIDESPNAAADENHIQLVSTQETVIIECEQSIEVDQYASTASTQINWDVVPTTNSEHNKVGTDELIISTPEKALDDSTINVEIENNTQDKKTLLCGDNSADCVNSAVEKKDETITTCSPALPLLQENRRTKEKLDLHYESNVIAVENVSERMLEKFQVEAIIDNITEKEAFVCDDTDAKNLLQSSNTVEESNKTDDNSYSQFLPQPDIDEHEKIDVQLDHESTVTKENVSSPEIVLHKPLLEVSADKISEKQISEGSNDDAKNLFELLDAAEVKKTMTDVPDSPVPPSQDAAQHGNKKVQLYSKPNDNLKTSVQTDEIELHTSPVKVTIDNSEENKKILPSSGEAENHVQSVIMAEENKETNYAAYSPMPPPSPDEIHENGNIFHFASEFSENMETNAPFPERELETPPLGFILDDITEKRNTFTCGSNHLQSENVAHVNIEANGTEYSHILSQLTTDENKKDLQLVVETSDNSETSALLQEPATDDAASQTEDTSREDSPEKIEAFDDSEIQQLTPDSHEICDAKETSDMDSVILPTQPFFPTTPHALEDSELDIYIGQLVDDKTASFSDISQQLEESVTNSSHEKSWEQIVPEGQASKGRRAPLTSTLLEALDLYLGRMTPTPGTAEKNSRDVGTNTEEMRKITDVSFTQTDPSYFDIDPHLEVGAKDQAVPDTETTIEDENGFCEIKDDINLKLSPKKNDIEKKMKDALVPEDILSPPKEKPPLWSSKNAFDWSSHPPFPPPESRAIITSGLRLGLSRKARIKSLHPYLQSKPI